MKRLLMLLAVLGACSGLTPTLAHAQIKVSGLTRIAPTTGLADSALFVCADSNKVGLRACKFSDVQKRLAFKTFDSVSVASAGAFTWGSRSRLSSSADGSVLLQNTAASGFTSLLFGGTSASFAGFFPSGTNIGVKKADGSAYADLSVQNLSMQGGAVIESVQNVTYSASMTINAAIGNSFVITATNGTAFTVNAPSNANTGQVMTVTIKNTSGGALGAVTWNAIFKMATWTSPATGNNRSITFRHDGTNWVEISRTTADVPN